MPACVTPAAVAADGRRPAEIVRTILSGLLAMLTPDPALPDVSATEGRE